MKFLYPSPYISMSAEKGPFGIDKEKAKTWLKYTGLIAAILGVIALLA